MIQFNLLPDVKLEYIRAQRTRRLVLSLSILITAAAIGLLIILLAVNALQKKHLDDVSADITSQTSKLKSQKDITRVLTVQNQLSSLTALHDQKPAASRLLAYLNQVTPSTVGITDFTMDATAQTFTITGKAKSLSDVNKYIDTLKFTSYSSTGDDAAEATKGNAFKDVVLTSFGLSSENKGDLPANYTINLAYDPMIFDITKKVDLVVPSLTTTRSELSNASDLFQIPNGSAGGTN